MDGEHKTALVTGSTSGIGEVIADKLASLGYNIMLHGLIDSGVGTEKCENLARKYNVSVKLSDQDIRTAQGVEAMCRAALDDFGQVDVLVNNAGFQYVAPVDQLPVDMWDAVVAINLSAAFHAIRCTLPGMRSRGWGRIINIASAHGLVASGSKAAYVAAKHGLVGLTKVVAIECARQNITCNAICPGHIDTPLVRNQVAAMAKAQGIDEKDVVDGVMLRKQPNRSFVGAEEIAGMVGHLVGPDANSLTGAALAIDGGWTAE